MKKAVFIALLALLALRVGIWGLEDYGRRSVETSGSVEPSAVAAKPEAQAPALEAAPTESKVGPKTVAQISPPINQPIAPPLTPSNTDEAKVLAPSQEETKSERENRSISSESTPVPSATPAPSQAVVQPVFDLPFGAIIQFLEKKPAATLQDVVAMLNRESKGKFGVPISVYFDDGAPGAQPVTTLNLPSGAKLKLPDPMVNACKRQEYLLGIKSIKGDRVQLALNGGSVEVAMPKGFAAAEITSFKDKTKVSSIQGPVSRPPLAVSDDGKKFFYFMYLPKDDAISAWWKKLSKKKKAKAPALSSPFLIYSLSEEGVEFSSEEALYATANFAPAASKAGKESSVLKFDYMRGISIEARGVCESK